MTRLHSSAQPTCRGEISAETQRCWRVKFWNLCWAIVKPCVEFCCFMIDSVKAISSDAWSCHKDEATYSVLSVARSIMRGGTRGFSGCHMKLGKLKKSFQSKELKASVLRTFYMKRNKQTSEKIWQLWLHMGMLNSAITEFSSLI